MSLKGTHMLKFWAAIVFFYLCAAANFVAAAYNVSQGEWAMAIWQGLGFLCCCLVLVMLDISGFMDCSITGWVCLTLYGKLNGYQYYVVTMMGNERRTKPYTYVHWTWKANAERLNRPEHGHAVCGPFPSYKKAQAHISALAAL